MSSQPTLGTPPLGIIEGFFGRSWSWQDRADYARFLAANGYHFYIYAPKNDHYLRRQWQQDWPEAEFQQLHHLRDIYRHRQLEFGLGLSPFELYCRPDREQRNALITKIKRINALQADILCILFDDMRGDLPRLAETQIELVQLAAVHSNAHRIIFCPTYYSFDPVLEKVFGTRPEHYWARLGAGLDPRVDIFWTGEKVCSPAYSHAHLEEVAALLQRKPFLWDNYPVNDGAVKSRHLHLRAFDASHAQLKEHVAGHAVNPMNQPALSRIALATLPRAYREAIRYAPAHAFADACRALCSGPLADYLLEDVALLQDAGLEGITEGQRHYLLERYQPLAEQVYAREICAWLKGDYAFDPTCLTD